MSYASDFVIREGTLLEYCGNGEIAVIPDGVTRIANRAFDHCEHLTDIIIPDSVREIGDYAFCMCIGLKEITIPAGVEKIGAEMFLECNIQKIICRGQTPKISKQNIGYQWGSISVQVEFPDVCFVNREKISALAASNGNIATAEEYAYVWRFQSGKAWDEALNRVSVDPNEVVQVFERMLAEDSKVSTPHWKRMLAYVELNAYNLEKSVISDLIQKISVKDKKAAALFEGNDAVQKALSEDSSATEHPVEKRVKESMQISLEYSTALKAIPSGVCYADSETVCAPMVLAYIVSEYMKIHDPESIRFVSMYKTACMPYHPVTSADEVAAELDHGQLQDVLKELAFEKGGTFILAYARYADEAHASALVTQMNQWDNWGKYAATGRKNIIIARCGLLLNETKAAMLHLDKVGKLDVYAQMRGTDAETLRDTVLSEFGFDVERKIRYELGGNAVTAILGNDLSLHIVDESTGREVKSVPKKNADPALFEQTKKEIADLKKNIKKVVTNRKNTLFTQFLNGQKKDAASWQKIYLKNPVLNAMAQLLVWCQGDKTFTLASDGPVDCRGDRYAIGEEAIGVAHPVEMAEELTAWQMYFVSRGIKQPFEQVWEPAYKQEDLKTDRFEGWVISAYKVSGKEDHGIMAYGLTDYSEEYGFTLKDCSLENTQSAYRFMHGTEATLTLGKLTFEKLTRYVNHIVYLFDKWTITDRILTDDLSVSASLPAFTLAQIMEFITLASENNCTAVLAVLLEYKNRKYGEFNPMSEFTLN